MSDKEKKKCFKCKSVKCLDDFYKHKEMADGHLGKCKECTKVDVTEHRNKNIERVREYDRKRAKSPRVVARKKRYAKRRNKAVNTSKMVYCSKARGELAKPKECSICGKKGWIVGHHNDYDKPLDVVWMCCSCHRKWHVENGSVGM